MSDAEIEARNAVLEDSVPAILDFVRRGGDETFPFIFIDPTGWTGFSMNLIAPLLNLDPGEVLINLMTKDVRRFVGSPEKQTQESFERLFGRSGIRERVASTQGLERDDVVVEEYCRSVRDTGRFPYVCTAIVLHPERDRTHFHLIYATRHRKGVEVFKSAEKKAMAVQEAARAEADKRRRRQSTGMASLFDSQSMHRQTPYEELREHYVQKSRQSVRALLESRRRAAYDEVWDVAMRQPMTWESDLKDWLKAWLDEGRISFDGWKPRQRVPQSGTFITWS